MSDFHLPWIGVGLGGVKPRRQDSGCGVLITLDKGQNHYLGRCKPFCSRDQQRPRTLSDPRSTLITIGIPALLLHGTILDERREEAH